MSLGQIVRRLARTPLPLLAPRDAYALWAETYPPRPHNPLMVAEQSVMVPILQAVQPARALDVGTGTGRYLPILAAAGARQVVGLDLSPVMLARAAVEGRRVCADACCLPFARDRFDLICSSLMVGDVSDLGGWIDEMARVLEPRGHLVYSDFHSSWTQKSWRRTFCTADGRQFELPYHPHAIEEHLQHLERAGLVIRTIREPRVEVPGGRRAPVVAVFHAIKPGLSRSAR